LSKTGEFAGGAAESGDKVEGANVVPAGKPGTDARETLTAFVDVPPPVLPPHPFSTERDATRIATTSPGKNPDIRLRCSISDLRWMKRDVLLDARTTEQFI
jgi:hypothetical protein